MHGKSSDFARHPPPRLPVPGTGVFLPPGSGNSSSSQQLPGKSSHNTSASPKGKSEGKTQRQDCNGSVDGTGSGRTAVKEVEQQSADNVVASKPAGAV
uniref:Uncharacterized protein n=1 Tax=Fagus sylvatica TaxID=28930 RepID=A0A2N9H7R2_FAGSY